MRRLGIILMLILLLAGSISVHAQDKWDNVLDRYEQICNQCKDLRARMLAGESVSDRSVTSLLGELNRLRSELQQASGSMTTAQKARFDAIRNSYNTGNGKAAGHSATKTDSPAGNKTATVEQKTKHSGKRPETKSTPRTARLLFDSIASGTPIVAPTLRMPTSNTASFIPCEPLEVDTIVSVQTSATYPSSTRFSIIPLFSYDGLPSAGLFAALGVSGWGGYISARSNFISNTYAYDCFSSGFIPGGGFFWGNGISSVSEWSVAAGIIKGLHPIIDTYLGVGYGTSILRWQDATTSWVRVRDASSAGVMIDGGIIINIDRIRLLAGCSWLTASPATGHCTPAINIGLGLSLK